jgi:dipeptidase
MGTNEHGVVIGNEAVHSRVPAQQEPALLGMDLLRLALERASSAAEAVSVITGLLERWGQGGDCGHLHPSFYQNAFLITDAREAFVLETVGRMWAVEPAASIRTISNAYSIGTGFSQASASLRADALAQGWGGAALDLAACYSDPVLEKPGFGAARCARSSAVLGAKNGTLEIHDVMAALRDHGAEAESDPCWHPQDTIGRTICMHAGDPDRRGQTTASLVSELRPNRAIHWVTGSAAPCTSVFKPVVLSLGLPPHGTVPTDRFDAETLWWRHEGLHRKLLRDPGAAISDFRAERDTLEDRFIRRIAESADREAVEACWVEAEAFEARWSKAIGNPPTRTCPGYAAAWQQFNDLAGLPKEL